MTVTATGSAAAMDYVAQTPAAMKGGAVRDAAQVLVARKARDAQSQLASQLISSMTDIGRSIDIKA